MKHLLLCTFHFLPWVSTIGLLLYCGRLRREIQRRIQENVEATQAALRVNSTIRVDDIELPAPADERWKLADVRLSLIHSKRTIAVGGCTLGPVSVADGHGIFVANRPITETANTKRYALTVLTTQRSRAVREALEKGETS